MPLLGGDIRASVPSIENDWLLSVQVLKLSETMNQQLPPGWITQTAPDGRTFYVNTADGTSHWTLPQQYPPSYYPPPPPNGGYLANHIQTKSPLAVNKSWLFSRNHKTTPISWLEGFVWELVYVVAWNAVFSRRT